jgi:hypothetical protein
MLELSKVDIKNSYLNSPLTLLFLPKLELRGQQKSVRNAKGSLYSFKGISTLSATTKERSNRNFSMKYQNYFNKLAEKFTMRSKYFETYEQLQKYKDLKVRVAKLVFELLNKYVIHNSKE